MQRKNHKLISFFMVQMRLCICMVQRALSRSYCFNRLDTFQTYIFAYRMLHPYSSPRAKTSGSLVFAPFLFCGYGSQFFQVVVRTRVPFWRCIGAVHTYSVAVAGAILARSSSPLAADDAYIHLYNSGNSTCIVYMLRSRKLLHVCTLLLAFFIQYHYLITIMSLLVHKYN